MRKSHLLFSMLVLSIALHVPGTLRAQCFPNATGFPSGFVPFTSVFYITAPNSSGDVLVVGSMTTANFSSLSGVALPNAVNQQFCDPVTLAPGLTVRAYVPTAAERGGTFSAFASLLVDPVPGGVTYSGGTIPLGSSLGDAPSVFAWRIPPGPPVYVSTFSGHQILKVDGNTGATTAINTDPAASPEDIVVGPDGKIYVCDSLQNRIRRIDPSSLVVETVYDFSLTTVMQCNGGSCPMGPEGPSFSTLGDLYFNTRSTTHTGVWKIPKSQLNPLPTVGTTTTPVNVVPAACATGSSFCDNNSTWGEGTVFDLTDKLLFVDRSGGIVWRFDPSTSPASVQQLISVPNSTFLGIAVGPNSGDIFVASRGSATVQGSIQRFGSNGTSMGAYVTAGTTGGFGSGDRPEFIKFDASGRLFVGTEQITFDSSGGVVSETTGKLWRVDPPVGTSTTGTATLVAALPAPPPNSTSPPPPPAVGIGVGSTSFSITQAFNLNGGTLTFARPTYSYIYQYPATTCTTPNAVNVRFTFVETTDAEWTQRVLGTPFAGTSLIHYAGTGGYGLVGRVEFFDATTNASVSCTTSSAHYNVITHFKTANPNGISSQGVGLLKAAVAGNDFRNIFVFYDPTDPTDGGTTCDGFSDFAAVIGVTGTAPTVTITTPTATAYTLTQTVLANYSCSPPAGTPPVLVCLGTVPNGSPIDTSSVGTKTFQVNTVVSAGPTAAQKVTYQVGSFNICLLYDTTKAAKSGSTIPIKLQLCDASGNDLSSSSIIVHATSVVQTSTFASSTVIDAGNANPDSDFRFDSTLGTTGGYIFNLQTTGLATGSYVLNFTAGPDPTNHTAPFQVR